MEFKRCKNGKKQFDYYIFIDYSENLIGYNIIEKDKIEEVIVKTSRFRHFKDARDKKLYLKNIKNTFKREKLLDCFIKNKVREMRDNLEIFSDIMEFLKFHNNCIIFISIDDKQYPNFERLIKTIDGRNVKLEKESELRINSPEYRLSLILDNYLNIERLKITTNN